MKRILTTLSVLFLLAPGVASPAFLDQKKNDIAALVAAHGGDYEPVYRLVQSYVVALLNTHVPELFMAPSDETAHAIATFTRAIAMFWTQGLRFESERDVGAIIDELVQRTGRMGEMASGSYPGYHESHHLFCELSLMQESIEIRKLLEIKSDFNVAFAHLRRLLGNETLPPIGERI